MREAVEVDVKSSCLIAEIFLQLLLLLLQLLQNRLLVLMVLPQILVAPEERHLVLLNRGCHGVVDVLFGSPLLAPRGTGRGQLHGLLQGADLRLCVLDGALGHVDLVAGLPELLLQAPPHLLIFVDPVLHGLVRLGRCLLRGARQALHQLAGLLPQLLGGLLPMHRRLVQTQCLLLPQHLVAGTLMGGHLVPGSLGPGRPPPRVRGRGHVAGGAASGALDGALRNLIKAP
mmetsp:Transcript_15399/g.36304  ORF Transcript_15399/g.36304 Transcript_15399/m.36304 type:complete len:230 (-) Transcript_15399:621-1310(-)